MTLVNARKFPQRGGNLVGFVARSGRSQLRRQALAGSFSRDLAAKWFRPRQMDRWRYFYAGGRDAATKPCACGCHFCRAAEAGCSI